MAVQIIRLKDGLDVFCNANDILEEVELDNPMVFHLKNQNLVLQQWLPLAVIKSEKVSVNKTDILCRMDPNDDFKEYYTNTVKELKRELREIKNEKDAGVDIMEALAELESNKDINIH